MIYRDDDMPEGTTLPLNDGLGIEWLGDRGEKYRTIYQGSVNPKTRKVTARVSSYTGTCAFGAMHWYGKIEPDRATASQNGDRGGHGGYLGKAEPRGSRDPRSFHVNRTLTKIEKDMYGELVGRVGEPTERFNSEQEVFTEMVKDLKETFGPGWVVVFELTEGGRTERPIEQVELTAAFYTQIKKECDE